MATTKRMIKKIKALLESLFFFMRFNYKTKPPHSE